MKNPETRKKFNVNRLSQDEIRRSTEREMLIRVFIAPLLAFLLFNSPSSITLLMNHPIAHEAGRKIVHLGAKLEGGLTRLESLRKRL